MSLLDSREDELRDGIASVIFSATDFDCLAVPGSIGHLHMRELLVYDLNSIGFRQQGPPVIISKSATAACRATPILRVLINDSGSINGSVDGEASLEGGRLRIKALLCQDTLSELEI